MAYACGDPGVIAKLTEYNEMSFCNVNVRHFLDAKVQFLQS